MSLARKHRAKMLAKQVVENAIAGGALASGPAATEYELQRAVLGRHLARLRDIQSIERKIELKRELLPDLLPWAEGVLAAAHVEVGSAAADEVLSHAMIWAIDIGDYGRALPMAEHVLRHRLPMPERFNRTAGTYVAEEIAEAALAKLESGEGFDLDLLLTVEAMTADEDMHDEVAAKLNKAIGRELMRRADAMAEGAAGTAIGAGADMPAGGRRAAIDAALRKLGRALELNPRAGVKKDIDRLEREAKKLAGAGQEVSTPANVGAEVTQPAVPGAEVMQPADPGAANEEAST